MHHSLIPPSCPWTARCWINWITRNSRFSSWLHITGSFFPSCWSFTHKASKCNNNYAYDDFVCVRACMCVCLLVCLLSSDPSQSDSNSKDFWFNMQALTSYLRKASDQNPSASYYNVDILKYQVSPIPLPNPDEFAVVKECFPEACFTPSFSHSRGVRDRRKNCYVGS